MTNYRPIELWQHLTRPHEADPDAARREYAVRVVLVALALTVAIAWLIFIIGWLAGAVSYIFPLSGLVACFLLGGSLWLTHLGYWRLTGYIPALIVFLAAVYGNYLQGIATGSVMFYLLTVILIGIIENWWAQWAAMLLCIVVYVGLGLAHLQNYVVISAPDPNPLVRWTFNLLLAMVIAVVLQRFLNSQLHRMLQKTQDDAIQLADINTKLAQESEERRYAEAERLRLLAEQSTLQQEIIEAQQRTLKELSTPVIPIMDRVIVMPLIGSIDTMRAKDITRSLLAGISQHRAKVVILDITGVPLVDSGVANHLNKTIQAARLKGTRTIVTGVSDAVAETIVDLGIDWGDVKTQADLQTGLVVALASLGIKLSNSTG